MLRFWSAINIVASSAIREGVKGEVSFTIYDFQDRLFRLLTGPGSLYVLIQILLANTYRGIDPYDWQFTCMDDLIYHRVADVE
jgi:hypothetical protein